jgi:hypothetical protein
LKLKCNQNCFFPVAVSEENLSLKSEKALHPIPSSLIQMNDRDKIELESVLFDDALRSVGLDFGFLKKAEKEAMKLAEKETSSDSDSDNFESLKKAEKEAMKQAEKEASSDSDSDDFGFLKKAEKHSDPDSQNCPKNQILSKNISWASIYPSQVIEVHFCVKKSYFSIFIKLANFGLFYLMNYKKNLAFSDQYSLSQPNLPKALVLHIKKTLPSKIDMNFGPSMSTDANSDFFSEIFH